MCVYRTGEGPGFAEALGQEVGTPASGQASARPLVTTVSLENVLLDVKELGRGMELIRRECGIHDNSVLRSFLSTNEAKLDKLQRDAKTAEVSGEEGVGVALSGTACSLGARPRPLPSAPGGTSPSHWADLSAHPPPGGLQCSCALLWRESQDHASFGLLPCVCPVHPFLQGELQREVGCGEAGCGLF